MIRLIAVAVVWMALQPATYCVQAGDPLAVITACDGDRGALPAFDASPSVAVLTAPAGTIPDLASFGVVAPLPAAVDVLRSPPRSPRLLC
jgi:hypothetical protein